MYSVYYCNCGYFAQDNFNTLVEAIDYAKKKHFECTIYEKQKIVGIWTPFGGFRRI